VDARRALAARAPLPAQDRHRTVTATITDIKYQVNVNTLEHVAAKTLELNEDRRVQPEPGPPIAFDPYQDNRDTGGFILIDRLSNNTVGAGLLHFALRRAHNIHLQHVDVDKTARARMKHQKGCVLWFTGLSGAGKSDDRQPGRAKAARAWATTPICSTATTCATA
jgi:bifunctional enzyme CysN/CysC